MLLSSHSLFLLTFTSSLSPLSNPLHNAFISVLPESYHSLVDKRMHGKVYICMHGYLFSLLFIL